MAWNSCTSLRTASDTGEAAARIHCTHSVQCSLWGSHYRGVMLTDSDIEQVLRESTAKTERKYVGVAAGAVVADRRATWGAGSLTAGEPGGPRADTLFQIGSITKVFTSLALADAVTRGELSLETPLGELIPETVDAGQPITLGQLASHTSGLPRLPKGILRHGYRQRLDPYRGFGADQMFEALEPGGRGKPGKVRYSNFGAALLGQALCRQSGLTFEQLIADRIAGPLGMTDTVVELNADQQSRKATGHSKSKAAVPDWDLDQFAGAGALFSTVNDMMTFLRANIDPDGTPLAAALRLAQTPRARANRWLEVGLGWHLSPFGEPGHSIHWHNGGTGGFFSFTAFDPAAEVGVFVVSNTARSVDRLAQAVVSKLVSGG